MRQITKTEAPELTREEKLQELVVSTLGKSTKPISGSWLAELGSHKLNLNISDVEIRRVIRELRASGSIIIANNRGYVVAQSKSEVQDYVEARKRELRREQKALSAMLNSYERATV
jgi:DNA-binding GntR family transcriptional regulator